MNVRESNRRNDNSGEQTAYRDDCGGRSEHGSGARQQTGAVRAPVLDLGEPLRRANSTLYGRRPDRERELAARARDRRPRALLPDGSALDPMRLLAARNGDALRVTSERVRSAAKCDVLDNARCRGLGTNCSAVPFGTDDLIDVPRALATPDVGDDRRGGRECASMVGRGPASKQYTGGAPTNHRR